MTTDFLVDVGPLCRTITLLDNTDYGVNTREDYGIAVFFSKKDYDGNYIFDSSLSDLSSPGATDSLGEWEIEVANETAEFLIHMFWAPEVSTVSVFYDGIVVFYDGYFYINVSGGSSPGTIPGPDWRLLTDADLVDFESDMPAVIREQDTVFTTECPLYLVKFASCDGNYVLIDNSDNENTKRYIIKDTVGAIVVDYTEFTFGGQTTLPTLEDNVYVITIEEEIDGAFEEIIEIPIYEYCKMKNCVTYLINSILCNEWDPCCDNCDPEVKAKMEKQRYTLNQLIALYGTFLSYIHTEHVQYLGVVEMDADRMLLATSIQQLMDKIEDILQRCELCQGAWQTSTATTNNNSSYKPCNC